MKVIGVIPARWSSTRFPGKSLAALCGKPLIQWVYERCRLSKRLDGLFVATDDERIRNAVKECGGDVIMTRLDHASGTDRVAEAVRLLQRKVDWVLNIQGDEPLIDPRLIDELIAGINDRESETGWDIVTAAAPIGSGKEADNPSACKVVFAADGRAMYFSRSRIPFVRDEKFSVAEPVWWRHIGLYLYRTEFLARFVAEPPCMLELAERLEQLRALHLGARIKVIQASCAGPGVDTPEDVRKVEDEIKRLGWA